MRLREVEARLGPGLLGLENLGDGRLEGLRFGQCLVRFSVAEVHGAPDLVDPRGGLAK